MLVDLTEDEAGRGGPAGQSRSSGRTAERNDGPNETRVKRRVNFGSKKQSVLLPLNGRGMKSARRTGGGRVLERGESAERFVPSVN